MDRKKMDHPLRYGTVLLLVLVGVLVSTSCSKTDDAAASQSAVAANSAAASANQAAEAAQDAADAAATSGDSSVEQQLAELKDMLDKGLITQQDYDDKKKQLLEGM